MVTYYWQTLQHKRFYNRQKLKLTGLLPSPASHISLLPLLFLLINNDYGEGHNTSHISEYEIINFLILI